MQKESISELKLVLSNRPDYVYTSILACTNDLDYINFLNKLDDELPRLDVNNDYDNELTEVKNKQGQDFEFSFGDYVTKCILGSIISELDDLDGPKTNKEPQVDSTSSEPKK